MTLLTGFIACACCNSLPNFASSFQVSKFRQIPIYKFSENNFFSESSLCLTFIASNVNYRPASSLCLTFIASNVNYRSECSLCLTFIASNINYRPACSLCLTFIASNINYRPACSQSLTFIASNVFKIYPGSNIKCWKSICYFITPEKPGPIYLSLLLNKDKYSGLVFIYYI